MAPTVLPSLCIALHVLLVVLHVLTAAFDYAVIRPNHPVLDHTEQRLVIVGSQIFAALYGALLVLVTQPLAFRRLIRIPQTLTAVHDKTSAWLGVGASLLAILRQRRLATDPWGILHIAMYLLLILTLHVTVSSTLFLSPALQNTTIPVPTQLAGQCFGCSATDGAMRWIPDPFYYSILYPYDGLDLLGVQGNMLYDIVQITEGKTVSGTVAVNATSITVDCGIILPDAQYVGHVDSGSGATASEQTNGGTFSFTLGGSMYTTSTPTLGFNALHVDTETLDVNSQVTPSPSFPVIQSLLRIVDGNGNASSIANITIPMAYQSQTNESVCAIVTTIQLLACNISTNVGSVLLDAQTRLPAENASFAPSNKSIPSTVWHGWAEPPPNSNVSDPVIAALYNLAEEAPPHVLFSFGQAPPEYLPESPMSPTGQSQCFNPSTATQAQLATPGVGDGRTPTTLSPDVSVLDY